MSTTWAEVHRKMANHQALTECEQKCVALLYDDGWSVGELVMTFQAGENAIRRAIDQNGGQP